MFEVQNSECFHISDCLHLRMSDSQPEGSVDSPRKVSVILRSFIPVPSCFCWMILVFRATMCAFCILRSWPETKGSTFQLNLTTCVVFSSHSLVIGGGCQVHVPRWEIAQSEFYAYPMQSLSAVLKCLCRSLDVSLTTIHNC